MNRLWKITLVLAFAMTITHNSFAQLLTPQGRLTLQSNTPVMTSDVVNTSTVYYTPYVGDTIPLGPAGTFANYTFSQLTLTLNSSFQTAGNIYDVFVYKSTVTGVAAIGINETPWPLDTSRGTTGQALIALNSNGIWAASGTGTITMVNGANTVTGEGVYIYVGSIYMTGNGETSVQFKPTPASGGTANVVGIWNAYNRVRTHSLEADNTTGWTYGTNMWREMDGNANNRVTYLDGLGQTFVRAKVSTIAYNSTATNGCAIGMLQNLTSGGPDVVASFQGSAGGNGAGTSTYSAEETFTPVLGLNYIQAMENSPNATTCTFAFNGSQTKLLVDTEF